MNRKIPLLLIADVCSEKEKKRKRKREREKEKEKKRKRKRKREREKEKEKKRKRKRERNRITEKTCQRGWSTGVSRFAYLLNDFHNLNIV